MKEKINALSEDLEILIDYHTNPMVLSDLNGKILAINKKLTTVFGKTKDELIGSLGFDHIGKHVVKNRKKAIEKVVKTKKPFIFEDKDYGRYWKTEIIPIFNKDGNIVKLATYIEDITEKKESEEKFSTLFENSNDAIFIHDLEGNILDANRKSLDIFGYSKQDLLLLNIRDLHPTSVRKKSESAFKRILKYRNVKFEIDFKKKNGDIFPTEVSSSIFKFNGKNIIQGIVRDITERKEILSKLSDSEEKFRMLSDQSLMGIGIIQGDKIIYANDAITKIIEYSKKELFRMGSKILSDIIHPYDLSFVSEQLKRKLSGKKEVVNRYNCRIITKNNNLKWLEIFSKTIIFEGKYADLITFVDITEIKTAEE